MRLSHKILFLMAIVGLSPLLIVGVISFTRVENSISRTTREMLTQLALSSGKEIAREVNEAYHNVLLLAQNPLIRSPAAHDAQKEKELATTQQFHRIFKDISLLNPEGGVVASAKYSFRGAWKTTCWFQSARKGKTVFSDVHAVLYPYGTTMTVATPVQDAAGKITGVLVGQIEMRRIWRITRQFSLGKSGQEFIIDRHGIVVSAPRDNQILEPMQPEALRTAALGQSGIVEYEQSGIRQIAAHVPISELVAGRNLDWIVILTAPRQQIYQPLFRVRRSLLVASAAALATILALSLVLSRRLCRRIETLSRAAQALGEGRFSQQILNQGNDEIGRLGKALDTAGRQLEASRKQEQAAKTALEQANRTLEERVRERTMELARAKDAAEAANRAKSDFLANMSHELRTPLNHIIGFTELVIDQSFGPLNETQSDYLQDALESSRHLLSLINDILDLSKIEAGRQELELSQIDLRTLLQNSLTMIREKTLKHGIVLETDFDGIPDTIRADERKLKQILYNLLSNAAKFTPDGGKIRLAARRVAHAGKDAAAVEIAVTDTGIGITPEDLARVFDPFEQVENGTARQYQGTGLGLALTRQLVELHGGRIRAQRRGKNHGAAFLFTLPIGCTPGGG